MGTVTGGIAAALLAVAAVSVLSTAPVKEAFELRTFAPSPAPALRAAQRALEGGERARAEELLVEIAIRHPIVADFADLMRLRLYVESARWEDAAELGASWSHDDSSLRAEALTLLGRVHAELGAEEAARGAWRIALEATENDARRASLRLDLAKSFEREALAEEAAAAWLEVWIRHPDSPESDKAETALDALEGRLGRKLRTPREYRQRGDVFFRLRHNEDALAAYERALATDGLSRTDRRRALLKRAETLFRLRRYTEAVAAYEALPRNDEFEIQKARARARSGDVPGAAKALEELGRRGRRQSPRANLLAGLLVEDEGETARARGLYRKVVQRSPSSSYGSAALWRLGWSAYLEGDDEAALRSLERLSRDAHGISGLRARYWYARAAERLGLPEARDSFVSIAREFPFSYYGWRATARLGSDAGRIAEVSRPEGPFDPGKVELAPRELARPRILLEAGMQEAALTELGQLYPRAKGLEDRLALAQLYSEAGEYHRAQILIVGAYNETLARGPLSEHIDMWWHAWPAPYPDEVGAATGGGHVDPWLVYAIMREESGYRPSVISVSGARGLLQLMPTTAERVAQRIAMTDFAVEDLFEPDVNIRLGSSYIEELMERFPGHPAAAIGSYNAGPEAVARWIEAGSSLEDDEWVEAIPYEQTRTYVKRVLRSIYVYQVLH